MNNTKFRAGYIALVGRPNVGKSTLLNKILGEKLSITSSKPQTTRQRIVGIKTEDDYQMVYVDTPGLHREMKSAMNRHMNKAATTSLEDVDIIVFLVDSLRWLEEDEWILARFEALQKPVILAINKIDHVHEREKLLPHIQMLSEKYPFSAIVPISAQRGTNVHRLEKEIKMQLPEQEAIFPADQFTDRSQRFLAAELIREKLIRLTGEELPYATTVEIDSFEQSERLVRIAATIWVERPGQKAIVIGHKGEKLKEIGTSARIDIEKMVDNKVFLQLWVKVRKGWADDDRALQSLGFFEQ